MWYSTDVFTIDVKNVFLFTGHVFFTLFNVFLFCQRFLFFKTFIENTILNHFRKNGNKLGLYDCFSLCPYRPIYWQALLFTYRIGLHQVTPLGDVFLFIWRSLVNRPHYLFDNLPSPVVYSYNLHEHFLILYNNNTMSALITNSKLSALSLLQSFQ